MESTESTEKGAARTFSSVEVVTGTTHNMNLKRGLKSRHIQFIALGGTIGTGLFLGIGGALKTSGPLSLFLGYAFTSVAVWAMMQSLGEMATWLPLPGMITQMGTRFVDPAFGFAIGWNQWYNNAIAIAAEVSAGVVLIQFWDDHTSPAVYITVILVIIFAINLAAVSTYGEVEFTFAALKIIMIVGLLILAVVLDLGGGPNHDRLGFRYWKSPYQPMHEYIGEGSTGRFLGLFSVLINAAFAFGGIEQVAIAAGEASNPRKTIPVAIRRAFWRILIFYVFGAFAIGCIVSSDDPSLIHGTGVAKSPWVIAIKNAGIPVLPHIINAIVISSASSSANANIYTGSRYLFALAQQKQAPSIFLRCTRQGVPIFAVMLTGSIGLLAYLTVSSTGADVFGWLSGIVATAYLTTWSTICFSYIRFHKALAYNNIQRDSLDFKAKFEPFSAWFGLVFFLIVIFFNGWAVFTHGNWNAQNFVSGYIGIPIFALLFISWKLIKRTKLIPIAEIDLFTGRVETTSQFVEDIEKGTWKKVWDWFA